MEDILIFPEVTPNSDPSWFGFPVMLREGVDTERVDMPHFLDQNNIGTPHWFAGNLT